MSMIHLEPAGTGGPKEWKGTNQAGHVALVGANGNPIYTFPVTVTGSNALLAGSGTAPLSGANAAAIAANACNAVVVQNDPDSTVDLMVGNSTTVVPLQLVPGQSVAVPVNNTSLVFVRSNHAATNATYNWLAV